MPPGRGSLYRDAVDKTEKFMREKYGDNWAPFTARHIVDRHSFVYCELTSDKLIVRAVDQAWKEINQIAITKA